MVDVTFVKRVTIEQICRELARPYADPEREGINAPALLDEVRSLLVPEQAALKPANGGSSRVSGSPAPWDSEVGPFLSYAVLDIKRWGREAAAILGVDAPVATRSGMVAAPCIGPGCFTCCQHESCQRIAFNVRTVAVPIHRLCDEDAARLWLHYLPGYLKLLEVEYPVHAAAIDRGLRSHYRTARELVGRAVKLERLPRIPNPDHPSHGGRPPLGPLCATACEHGSCNRIWHGSKRSISMVCAGCGADSLRHDPVSGWVSCLRESCKDKAGRRTAWHVTDIAEVAANPWGEAC